MINDNFNFIVSLGSFCQTAYQIRRYFGNDKAHIFDWWVTPSVGLVELLENCFDNIFIESELQVVNEDAGPAVMSNRYGIMHYHDFDNSKVKGRPIPLLMRAECAVNLSKFSYLAKRFLELSGKILFIRAGDGYVQNYTKNQVVDGVLAQRLISALENMFPNSDFRLLLLNTVEFNGLDSRINFDTVENYGETLWYGSDKGWDEMFDRQGISLVTC